MAGFNTIVKFNRLQERLQKLGFVACHPRHGNYAADLVAIKPKDNDSLPSYTRDAQFFCGSIDELERWLDGVEWARDYDRIIFGKNHDNMRERKEQDVRNKNLIKLLKKD